MPRHPRPPVPAWATPWIDSFALALRARPSSPNTVTMYIDAVRWFAGWADVDDWADVAHLHLRQFFVHLADLGYAPGYVNNLGRCLQQFFGWYADEEGTANPFSRIKPPAAPKLGSNPRPVIEHEQLALLIKEAERGREFIDRRDAALIRLFACTGCRLSEVALLQVDDVNPAAREALVRGKGGKSRVVRFDHKAALALDRYLRARARQRAADSPALWLGEVRGTAMTPSGVRQAIGRRATRLGLRIHPHLFRHTFSHNWLDQGGAEGDLMELNGWDSPAMLRVYGRSARAARARRHYDQIDVMGGV